MPPRPPALSIPIVAMRNGSVALPATLAGLGGHITPTGQLTDTLGRPLRDLRISVTDRCNFRCSYCMPKET